MHVYLNQMDCDVHCLFKQKKEKKFNLHFHLLFDKVKVQSTFKLLVIIFAILSIGGSTLFAGTIVIPSRFVLHRPLNPALTVNTTGWGFAYGGSVGNRDLLNSAPSNCELKQYSQCHKDISSSRFLYGNLGDIFYLQVENLSLQKHERNNDSAYSINFNQREYDILASLAIKTSWLSIGTYYRETDLRLREFYLDVNGGFSSELIRETFTPGYGIQINFGELVYFSYYGDGPTSPRNSKTRGRDFELLSDNGLKGGGIGVSISMSDSEIRPDEINLEAFHLYTTSPLTGEDASLTGVDFEITYFSLVFYSLVLRDNENNFFTGELLRDSDISYATGIGYNGELIQILIGRDPRYFAGLDGGAQMSIGLQF